MDETPSTRPLPGLPARSAGRVGAVDGRSPGVSYDSVDSCGEVERWFEPTGSHRQPEVCSTKAALVCIGLLMMIGWSTPPPEPVARASSQPGDPENTDDDGHAASAGGGAREAPDRG